MHAEYKVAPLESAAQQLISFPGLFSCKLGGESPGNEIVQQLEPSRDLKGKCHGNLVLGQKLQNVKPGSIAQICCRLSPLCTKTIDECLVTDGLGWNGLQLEKR